MLALPVMAAVSLLIRKELVSLLAESRQWGSLILRFYLNETRLNVYWIRKTCCGWTNQNVQETFTLLDLASITEQKLNCQESFSELNLLLMDGGVVFKWPKSKLFKNCSGRCANCCYSAVCSLCWDLFVNCHCAKVHYSKSVHFQQPLWNIECKSWIISVVCCVLCWTVAVVGCVHLSL